MALSSSWQGALTYANDLILCGFDDWRMPNRKELWSLAHYGRTNTAAYLVEQGFVDLLPETYWSSTSQSGTPDAWSNYFDYGRVVAFDKTSQDGGHSWAVRAGGIPDIVISPGALDFKDVIISQTSTIQTITITNTGAADLIVNSIEITGTSQTLFAAGPGVTNGCALPNATIIQGASCTLDVTFTPTALGPQDALLYINSNDPGTARLQVSLTGEGVIALSTPSEGTIGTEITIIGSGFGTQKGKVLIGGVAAKIAKDGWADDRIIALLTKVPPAGGPYNITITPQKAASITLSNAFTVKYPGIDSLDFYHGAIGDPIIITGNFFSTKKGKVYLGDQVSGKKKNCKVTSWGMDSITFVVPKTSKSFPAGTYFLDVVNKIGVAEASSGFTID
jgi:hypothetical protein